MTSSAYLTQNPTSTPQTNVNSPTQLKLPQTTHILTNNDGEVCGDGSGQAPLLTAFAQSCDTTFGSLGMTLGAPTLNNFAELFGMNSKTLRIPMPVTPSNYVDTGTASQALTAFSAIGQYSDTVTPLQEAMFAASIANGGKLMTPYLVKQVTASDLSTVETTSSTQLSQAVSPGVATDLGQMMLAVVQDSDGTANAYNTAAVGFTMAGKTGTAQNGPNNTGLNDAVFTCLRALRQPADRRGRHNSRRRVRGNRCRPHRCPGHQGLPGIPGEVVVTDYLLAGRYRLTDRIAAGGMGEVWRGEDVLLNRAVAVKLLPTGRAGDESFLARFRAEARYAASLSHPGIARVYDYGESAEFGGAYLIMELVKGEPLSAILARAGRLSPDATLDIVGQAARALDAAHQAGIVHRDIKPGNLLVAAGGTTKITDFGIATAVRAAQASHLTETGMVMGTAMYVSPEQATGAPVDASSDIYSLGVVAYECLAGHVPFMASEPLAIAYAHKHAPIPALPPDVPQPVADLVYDMLAKTPAGRPVSSRVVADRADMLREALFLGGGALGAAGRTGEFAGVTRADLPAAPTGALRPDDYDPAGYEQGPGPRPPGNRRRWVTAGLTAALCAAAAATGLYLSGHLHGQTSGDVGNTVQHLSSSAVPSSASTSQPVTTSPTPSTVEPSTVPASSASPKPQ